MDEWTGAGDGTTWDNPLNWAGDLLPLAGDNVQINVAGNVTIVHPSGNDSLGSLICNAALALSGGTLNVSGTIEVNNTFTLGGGTLAGGTVPPGSGGQGLTCTSGTLSGVH